MDLTLLHPKVVHLPIALAVLMPLVSGGLLLAWWREWLPRRAWLVAVLFQATMLISGFAAIETGEADEDVVENVVAEQFIEAHEEAAEQFQWAVGITLLLFLAGALIPDERNAKGLGAAATLATLAVLTMGVRVGEAGGALVYEHGAASAHVNAAGATQAVPVKSGHDDDDD